MFATVDEMGRVAAAEDWDIEWRKGGTVVAGPDPPPAAIAPATEIDELQLGLGPDDSDLLDGAAAERRLDATDSLGGTYTPDCAAIHPARLVRSLAPARRAAGAVLHERTRVEAIEPGIVRTANGTSGPRSSCARPRGTRAACRETRALAPVYSLMLATEPLPAEAWDRIGLAERETFADGRHLIIYGQRTADGRLAFGGRGAPYHFGSRISPEQDRNAAVHAALWEVLTDLFPVVSRAAVTHTWGGPLGVPRDWWASVRPRPADGPRLVRRLRRRRRRHVKPGRTHPGGSHHRHAVGPRGAALGQPPVEAVGARAVALAWHERRPARHDERGRQGGPHRPAVTTCSTVRSQDRPLVSVARPAMGGLVEVKELGHLVLYVRDIATSARFYRDILGWRQIMGDDLGSIPVAAFASPSLRTHHELLLIEVGAMPPDPRRSPRGDVPLRAEGRRQRR